MQQQSTAGVHLPLVNEIAAITIGCGLTHPHADSSFKAAVEKNVAALAASDSKVRLVYAQNTPGELNVVVPDFPEIDKAVAQMSEEDLAQVAGGELFIGGIIAFALGSIGATIGIGSVSLAAGVGPASARLSRVRSLSAAPSAPASPVSEPPSGLASKPATQAAKAAREF